MENITKWIGFAICLILSMPLVACEVETLTFDTDVYWKTIDFEDSNWAAENYDDSWWEDSITKGFPRVGGVSGDWIWYPGDIKTVSKTAYFRKSVDIPGNEILNGVIHTILAGSGGDINLYVNNVSIGRWIDPIVGYAATVDITRYLKIGENIIAAKVEVTGSGSSPGFILDGVIRYNSA